MKKYLFAIVLFLGIALSTAVRAEADTSQSLQPVSIGTVDYEELEMTILKGDNNIVYCSTDKKNWSEVEGVSAGSTSMVVDISWVSTTADVVWYLKGDKNVTQIKVVFPKQEGNFKPKFDKLNGDFEMTGQEDKEYFYYRKSTDYFWQKVYFEKYDSKAASDRTAITYSQFRTNIESLRYKGAKLCFKLGQTAGSGLNNMGERPSKEVSVSVTKYATAPSVRLNLTTLKFNTKDSMEWTTDFSDTTWTQCVKNEKLVDLLKKMPEAAGKDSITVYFRMAATDTKPHSLAVAVTIPKQGAMPVDNVDYKHSMTSAGKCILEFPTASSTNMYEYCVCPASEFDEYSSKWRTVKASKPITISTKLMNGATVYVRKKGTAENAAKKIEFTLPSEYNHF